MAANSWPALMINYIVVECGQAVGLGSIFPILFKKYSFAIEFNYAVRVQAMRTTIGRLFKVQLIQLN